MSPEKMARPLLRGGRWTVAVTDGRDASDVRGEEQSGWRDGSRTWVDVVVMEY